MCYVLFVAYAFAELIDNALAATVDNMGARNIEMRLVSYYVLLSIIVLEKSSYLLRLGNLSLHFLLQWSNSPLYFSIGKKSAIFHLETSFQVGLGNRSNFPGIIFICKLLFRSGISLN